jgi:hypothetical protein
MLYMLMSSSEQIRIGDRVCVISSSYSLPRGTRGTVLLTLHSGSIIYDVRFDNVSMSQLIAAEWLCPEAEWDAHSSEDACLAPAPPPVLASPPSTIHRSASSPHFIPCSAII